MSNYYQSGLYFLAMLSVIGAIITVIGVRETAAKLSLGVVPMLELGRPDYVRIA